MNLENYLEQHTKIKEELQYISNIINNEELLNEVNEIVFHINTLAGRLNMHLAMEDKYLYPRLKEKGDESIKKMTEQYEMEMGGLFEVFKSYKETYNTKNKLNGKLDHFIIDTKEIIRIISERMEREEQGLYQLI